MKPDSVGMAMRECAESSRRNKVVPVRGAPTTKKGAGVELTPVF